MNNYNYKRRSGPRFLFPKGSEEEEEALTESAALKGVFLKLSFTAKAKPISFLVFHQPRGDSNDPNSRSEIVCFDRTRQGQRNTTEQDNWIEPDAIKSESEIH